MADTAQTQGENNHVDVKAVVETGMENALENGRKYKDVCLVRNNYTGREISVSANTLRHGLGGNRNRVITNAKATEKIGEILKNSIPVNGLKNKADVDSTYAMAGILMDTKGNQFIAISTIEQKSDKVSDIAVYDIAHAMNARMKKGSTTGMFHPQGVPPRLLPTPIKYRTFCALSIARIKVFCRKVFLLLWEKQDQRMERIAARSFTPWIRSSWKRPSVPLTPRHWKKACRA